MKILVTGGTGFLGTHLVPQLLAQGHSVRLFGRTPPRALPAGVEFLQGDVKDSAALKRAVAGIEAIYHLAGLVSFRPEDGRKMYELHVEGTRQLLGAAREAGQKPRIVLASTSGTIAVGKDDTVRDETHDYPITVVGKWPYYLSKIYEEKLALEYCRKHALPLVVLNPSLLLGPGDERLSSTWTVVKFLNRDIPAMPSGGISFVDVRDAAKAFVAALTDGELQGRHLMGVNMPLSEFFERLERLSGVPAPRLKLPSKLNIFGAQLLGKLAEARGSEAVLHSQEVEIGEHFFYLDASKAEQLLGFRARDPQETLFETVRDVLAKLPAGSLPGTKGRLADLRAK